MASKALAACMQTALSEPIIAAAMSHFVVAGSEFPDWLAAPAHSQSKKPSPQTKPSASQHHHSQAAKQRSHDCKPALTAPADQAHDAAAAEHLLDVWVSDTDEPAPSSKHRYARTVTSLYPRLQQKQSSFCFCRLASAAVHSSSDSDSDAGTASWKPGIEDSRPKQRQVGCTSVSATRHENCWLFVTDICLEHLIASQLCYHSRLPSAHISCIHSMVSALTHALCHNMLTSCL